MIATPAVFVELHSVFLAAMGADSIRPGSILPTCLALFSWPGGWELVLILIVALLLFGKRLPDVARSFGKSIVEFKKGIRDVQNDVEEVNRQVTRSPEVLPESPKRPPNPPIGSDGTH